MANIEQLYDELNALLDQRDESRKKDKRIDFEIDALKRRIKQAEKLREYSANVNDYFWVWRRNNSGVLGHSKYRATEFLCGVIRGVSLRFMPPDVP